MTKLTKELKKRDWSETVLGKIVELVGGGTPKTNVTEYWNGDIPWLSVTDFNNESRWVSKTEKTITEKGLKESSTKILEPRDLIISARGTVGALSQVKKKMAFNQSCYGVKNIKGVSDKDFLYYLIETSLKNIKKNVHGAVFDTITKQTFDKIDIILPPLPEQKEIANILSSLDDKIELLQEQNKILEETAQTIFKEWFGKYSVDRPNELPEGWRVGNLSEIAFFLNGLAMQKFPAKNDGNDLPVIKIRELRTGITKQSDICNPMFDKKYLVNNGDVVFSWSGSLDVVIWKYGKGGLNQHLFKVTSSEFPKWFYYYWLIYHLENFKNIAANKATTMGHIQRQHLDLAKVIIPNIEDLSNFDVVMSPILKKQESNDLDIGMYKDIRDYLLPKLICGKLILKK